ncbi:MAG: hypothetical protein PVF28_07260 [Thioalkalispiraceae bacterium]|jgi:hypothetical protein
MRPIDYMSDQSQVFHLRPSIEPVPASVDQREVIARFLADSARYLEVPLERLAQLPWQMDESHGWEAQNQCS